MKAVRNLLLFVLVLLIIPFVSALAGPPMYHPILADPDDLIRVDPFMEAESNGGPKNYDELDLITIKTNFGGIILMDISPVQKLLNKIEMFTYQKKSQRICQKNYNVVNDR